MYPMGFKVSCHTGHKVVQGLILNLLTPAIGKANSNFDTLYNEFEDRDYLMEEYQSASKVVKCKKESFQRGKRRYFEFEVNLRRRKH